MDRPRESNIEVIIRLAALDTTHLQLRRPRPLIAAKIPTISQGACGV